LHCTHGQILYDQQVSQPAVTILIKDIMISMLCSIILTTTKSSNKIG